VKHTVKLHGVIVGHSELEHIERGVGRAWGSFRPGLGYELVQPVFRLYAQAVAMGGAVRDEALLARYYNARDALQLELVDARGSRISTNTIHIADYTIEEGPSAIALDVLIPDDGYWRRRLAVDPETRPARD
jgi:hypothetical protein